MEKNKVRDLKKEEAVKIIAKLIRKYSGELNQEK